MLAAGRCPSAITPESGHPENGAWPLSAATSADTASRGGEVRTYKAVGDAFWLQFRKKWKLAELLRDETGCS